MEEQSQELGFPGQEYTQARESLSLSIEQASKELHLPKKVLETIESGALKSFHNPVFMRGYVCNYAKYLGLDPDHYAKLYAQYSNASFGMAEIKSTSRIKQKDPSKSFFMKVFSIAFLLLILAVLLWWVREQYSVVVETDPQVSSFETSGTVQQTQASSALTNADPINQVSAFEAENVEIERGEEADADQQGEGTEQVRPQEEQEEVEQRQEQVSGLFMRFSGECWVQITDASGATLYSGVAQRGTELQLDGSLPLSLVLGRKDAVEELVFNGESINISSLSSGSVARFSLPLN